MTIKEALNSRIPRVRKAVWGDQQDYLRLPLFDNGTYGPWAELYSDRVQQDVLGERPGSQRLFVLQMLDDEPYEAYTGPVSSFETHEQNFAKSYSES